MSVTIKTEPLGSVFVLSSLSPQMQCASLRGRSVQAQVAGLDRAALWGGLMIRLKTRATASRCFLQVDGGFLAFFSLNFEGDFLTFVQAAHAGALNGRDVYEHVIAAAVGLNEAKTLSRVKPFYCSGLHFNILSQNRVVPPAGIIASRRFVRLIGKAF
jgi:hypothetical protein